MSGTNYRPGGNAWRRPSGPEASRFHDALTRVYPRSPGKSSVTATPLYINTPQGPRCAGQLEARGGQLVFVKHAILSKHLHRKLDAWGLDEALLNELVRRGVKAIKVVADTGTEEVATVAQYQLRGIRMDFGHNKQVFLPRQYFQRAGGAGN